MWTLTFSSMSITCLSCVYFYCMLISTATQVFSTRSQLRLSESPLPCILESRSALLHDCAMACSYLSLILFNYVSESIGVFRAVMFKTVLVVHT